MFLCQTYLYEHGGSIIGDIRVVVKLRVLIVEGNALMLDGLSSILASEQDMEVVGYASIGHLGVKLASQIKPDVVLVDMQLEDMSALDTVTRLRQSSRHMAIVIMTTYRNDIQACLALKVGATLCVLKSMTADELVEAVRTSVRRHVDRIPQALAE
jgi:DNA-binding NarL/FixJ family response regulator